ncbi:coiled-coil domain-containing protein [Hymenobacter fodinae]|uniref:Uncharacterized protein n=1 Tax=Hymenobacter fodinae TaxID=2510796 RepID=A0A4Z0NYV7_9BACT|nr:hypothetical protein [Hymenobacter fodinae]TGE03346.1 hypothetical protein EU556_25865 [Hymenobacter fodinae]
MPDVGTVYKLDFTEALAGLQKLADADRTLRTAIQQGSTEQRQVMQQVAQQALQASQQVMQQAQQQRLIRQVYQELTAELRAQEKAEKALNAEREKASVSTKRQAELKQQLEASSAAQQRLREEIERVTAAEQTYVTTAQTAAAVPPRKPPGTPTTTAAASAAPDRQPTSQQEAYEAALQRTTDALQQQAEAERAVAAATDRHEQAVAAAAQAKETAAAQTDISLAREKELREARQLDMEQLGALKEAEKALKAERAQTAPGERKNDLQIQLNENAAAQRSLTDDIKQTTQAIEVEKQTQRSLTAEAKSTAEAQKQSAREVAAAEKQLAQSAKEVAATQREQAKLQRQAREEADKHVRSAGLLTKLEKQLTDLTEARARATSKVEVQGYSKQIADTKRQIDDLKGGVDKTTGATRGLSNAFAAVGGLAAGVFVADKAVDFVKNIVSTRAEFERLEAVLTNTFGGNQGKAQQALSLVATFARDTGQNVTKLTDSYLTLVNRGIEPTRRQLEQLSDVAITSRKTVDQYVEAIVDAQQGQFERLTEFGIKAKVNGDKIAFTFRGTTTEVQNSTKAVADYLFGLGDVQGVMGATAAAADGFAGSSGKLSASLTELFDVLGDGTNGPLAEFIQRVTRATRSVAEFFKSTDRKATEAAAQGIQDYAQIADQAFADAAAAAERAGTDRNAALKAAFEQQDALLAKQQQQAAARAKAITDFRQAGSPVASPLYDEFRRDTGIVEGMRLAKDAEITAKTRLKLAEGERNTLKERYELALKGNQSEIEQLGVIEALRKKIAADEKILEQLSQGADFETKRKAQVTLLKQEREELERLLGKQKEARKGPDYLKQLLAAEAKLRDDANKLELEMLKDQGQAKAAEQLSQAQAEINRVEENLKRLEKLAGRDGVIDDVQRDQLNSLRLGKLDDYYRTLREIAQRHSDELFDLQADSDRKETEAIDRKYEKLAFAARGQADLELALEEAKQRDLLALQQRQEQRTIDTRADISRNLVSQTVGEVYGEGTGISVIEAKRKEKAELLEIDRQHAQDTLNNALKLTGEEGTLARTAAAAQLARVKNAIRDVEREKAAHPAEDFLYKLVLGEEDSDEARQQVDAVVGQVLATINTILAAEQQAAQAKIDAKTREIDDLQRNLDRELQYNKEGSASNIANTHAEIAAAKAARREALEDQKRAAKQQQLINDLQAVSSISLAVANVIAGWSSIPLVGSILGAVAAAAMVASFVATKAKAKSAAQSNSEGYFQGGYTGGSDKHEERGVVHGKEFVHTAEVTEKYRIPLFEALHKGRPQDIDWQHPTMKAILPDMELPKKLREEKQAAAELKVLHQFAPMQREFEGMKTELAAIRQHVGATAARPDVFTTPDGKVVAYDPATRSVVQTTYE